MNNNQLLDKLHVRFDELRDKLDTERAERNQQALDNAKKISALETRQDNQAGQIKIIYSLITAGITGIITWITSQFK